MAGNKISIELDKPAKQVYIIMPVMDNDPSMATLYNKLGGTLEKIKLGPGENRISLNRFTESSLVIRVETRYQTIVQELELQ